MLAEEQPQFYFAVAQQPDIVNTALLDGNTVSHEFVFHSVNNSLVSRQLEGAVSNPIDKPRNFSCSASANNVVILSGKCIHYYYNVITTA